MALIEQGILGAFRGKCGNIIGYIRNGVPCIRSMPTHYRDRRSQQQLENRSRLSMIMKVMSLARPVISLGFKHFATSMTSMNAATQANYYTLVKPSHQGLRYDFSSLLLSRGPVEPLSDLIMCPRHSSIDLIWNGLSIPGGSRDQVSVVLLNTRKMALRFFHSVATREDGTTTIAIPTSWNSEEIFCYLLVERNGNWSNSHCAGPIPNNQQSTSSNPSNSSNPFNPSNNPKIPSHQSALKDLSTSGPPRPDD